jgi:hypothetical protein
MSEPAKRPQVYLVWSQNVSGQIYLRAVYTEDKRRVASNAVKASELERTTVRAWIEQRDANHFFGEMMIG